MNRLESFRASYARLITTIAGVPADSADGARLIEVFASVPREQFIGPGPWRIVTQNGYANIPSDDPAFLHQDFAVALQPERQLNNGQPSLHARCFAALQLKAGERVLHVGAGTGYYSALLANLVGPTGSVVAYEIDKDLADKAAANLTGYANVVLENRSATEGHLPECDAIYVNAGATGPMDVWLDALRPGGRLLFPLTVANGFGAMLLVTKMANGDFAAKFVVQAAFIHCVGARDEELAQRLAEAHKTGGLGNAQRKGGMWDVKSLHRNTPPDETCWLAGKGWWLSTKAATPMISNMSEILLLGGKVRKQALAVVPSPSGPDSATLKRLMLPQGELAQFYDGEEGIRYIAQIELQAGSVRGNHYHKIKDEWVYLISGEVNLIVEDLESKARESAMLMAGDLAFIRIGIVHALQVTKSGQAIEFSTARFNPADIYRHKLV
jgi:protein-L-isoaspartate(D-aspartate) O-methyltransferase